MVRLLLMHAIALMGKLGGFNPTMVRLLQGKVDRGVTQFMFQSHNGAIAAQPTTTQPQTAPSFQSHNGAIAA